MKRVLVFLLVLLFLMSSFVSCHFQSNEKLSVHSTDYPKLKELYVSEFDYQLSLVWYLPEYNPYSDYSCSISIKDDALFIENENNRKQTFLETFDEGYFVGVDLGEFDGWVKYYPYYSNVIEEYENGVLVALENCKGIIKKDNQHGFIVAGQWGEHTGGLYELICKDHSWNWIKKCSFDGEPMAYCMTEDGTIYIVTTECIVSVNSDFIVQTIVRSKIFSGLGANSIVYFNNSIYCGSPMGVYQYSIDTQKETWYGMNYEEYVE